MGNDVGHGLTRSPTSDADIRSSRGSRSRHDKPQTLGILAFETAKTMSRLLSIHKSLTESEIMKLRNEAVKSEGVAYLISKDQDFLLNLACREKFEDVDRVAVAVARLGKSCSDPMLNQFGRIYDELKLGFIDIGTFLVTKDVVKAIEKLEKFIATTAELYSGLEALSEMEISERKIKQWKLNVNGSINQMQKMNFDLFDQKLSWQKQRVRHLRQISLWDKSFDKAVGLMARIVCVVYARIRIVFASHVPLIRSTLYRHVHIESQQVVDLYADSCLVDLSQPRGKPVQHRIREPDSCPVDLSRPRGKPKPDTPSEKPPLVFRVGSWGGSSSSTTRLVQQPSPSTVGGSGLPLRYANVVIIAERYLMSECASIDKCEREYLYQMLPVSLRRLVRSKLKSRDEVGGDESVVIEGWLEELRKILLWLGPMAHDTMRWQMERSVEKQSFEVKPRVLLLQTLFFADREKTEDAIAEILVGLSCICRYKQQVRKINGRLPRKI